MGTDFLTRLYLRHYAFLVRRYPQQPTSAVFHLATLGVSVLISAWLLAIVAVAFWLATYVLGRPIAPWSGPNWLVIVGSLGLVFLPSMYVDRKFRFVRVDIHAIENYSTRRERFVWWLFAISILLSAGIVAACLGAIRLSG